MDLGFFLVQKKPFRDPYAFIKKEVAETPIL